MPEQVERERVDSTEGWVEIRTTHEAERRRAFPAALRWLAGSIVGFAAFFALRWMDPEPGVLRAIWVWPLVASVLGGAAASFVAAAYATGATAARRSSRYALIRVDSRGIAADGAPWIASADIEGGAGDDDGLVLSLRDRDEVRVRGTISTPHALDLLGIGPDRRRAIVRWTVSWERALVYGSTVTLGLGSLIAAMKVLEPADAIRVMPFCLPVFVLAWPFAAAVGEREVIVGSDALCVRSARRVTSLRLAELRAVREAGRDILIERDEGPSIRVAVAHDGTRRALLRRIERAIADASRSGETARIAQLLERRGRTLEAWKAALAALLDARAGHREGALTRDSIASVLEDPSASAEQRIGATLALTLSGDAHDERIGRVIETTASSKLRVALDEAARGVLDESTLDDAAPTGADVSDATARGRARRRR